MSRAFCFWHIGTPRLDISSYPEIIVIHQSEASISKTHTLNGIGHFDIAGPDIAPLGSFYSSVLGWQITPRGPGYAMVGTPEGTANGALVEAETASLTIGIVVPDLPAALHAAEASGGSVAMPLTDNGWVKKAQVRDPAGNLLTLIQG